MRNKKIRNLLSGSALATLAAVPAFAQEVTITSADRTISITGDLVNFDGSTYTLSTQFGQLVINKEGAICAGAGCPVDKESFFTFAGSRALSDSLIPVLVKGYGAKLGTDVSGTASNDGSKEFLFETDGSGAAEIVVRGSNTRNGMKALLEGDATFALATRTANSREVRSFEEANLGNLRASDQQHIVAVDGLLLVTHPDNSVRAISEINAALTFGGQITNWSALGGFDAPINLYVREADSGTREVLETLLMRPNGLQIASNVTVLESDNAVAEAVASDPNGFGFTSFAQAGEAEALDIEGVCGLRTPATAFTIKTEEYPLTRLMYMYQAGGTELDYHAQGFLDFLETDAAQAAVAEAGFVDQLVSTVTINSQGIRVASSIIDNDDPRQIRSTQAMLKLLIASDRLSTTFRFETGSARLDARARADVARLAEILNEDRFQNKEVLFAGFTDSVGQADLNELLSAQRAELIRRTVMASNPSLESRVKTSAVGFGEASPLGCNETDVGRRTNRRVEVWVRDIVAEDRR